MRKKVLVPAIFFVIVLIVLWYLFSFQKAEKEAPPQKSPPPSATSPADSAAPHEIKFFTYKIINIYSHDPGAFTQGLAFEDGILYEGTGGMGVSTLRKVDLQTGKVLLMKRLRGHYFGEGVTIYRDGSKENQVLSFAEKEKKEDVFMTAVKERPDTLEGFTTKMATGMGNLYVTVTEYEGRPFEVFATIGKSGRSTTAKTEAIGRLVSLALRSGVRVEKVVEQLEGIGGEHPVFQKDGLVLSIPDAISRVLKKRYMSGRSIKGRGEYEKSLLGETCPECGHTISFEEGCMTCHFCGFTKCG